MHKGNIYKHNKILYKYRKYEQSLGFKNQLFADLDHPANKTFSYNYLKHNTPAYGDNEIRLLTTPVDILKEIVNLIEKAERFINLEFYVFSDGLVSNYVLELLKAKAEKGVEVRLMVDYLGNFRRLSPKTKKKIKRCGIELRIFNPWFKSNNLWWQFRNHNKLIVVDNKYALCGSCNIADEYFNITNHYFQTTELCAAISGPIVNSMNSLFFSHWDMCKSDSSRRLDLSVVDGLSYFKHKNLNYKKTNTVVQLLNSSPVSNEQAIKDNLIQLIFSAKKQIIISTPYFYPPKEIINALRQVSTCGISVKILMPKQPDFKNFFRNLNRQLLSLLMHKNIEIYEYFGFNHEKIMIVDDETVYFGSYNWDYRALYLNFENALLVKCKNLNKSMRQFMDQQFKNSHQVTDSDLENKNFFSECCALFIRLFKPFL